MIDTAYYEKIDFSVTEALRYLGMRGAEADGETLRVLEEARAEAEQALTPAVRYTEAEIVRGGEELRLSCIRTNSEDLKRNLFGCERAVLFCATVGLGIDRLLVKYGRTHSLKCALLQAIGAAYAESLCDRFCGDLQKKYKGYYLRPRFSCGYGDFPLSAQREFFQALSPEKIGVTLNDSLLMSPSKSVTAVVGMGSIPCKSGTKGCAACEKTDCNFRSR